MAGRPLRRLRNVSEGERHISYEEQERRRKLYAPSREKAAERRRLRAALAILAEADLEAGRVAEARKKGASARPPKPVYTKEYLASKGMKRNGVLARTMEKGVRLSRTPRTAPGGAWYGVVYQPQEGGGPGGYRAPGAGARGILGPFEKKADIPTHLGQFRDGGFIRAVKLTSEMPNWMRKLPHLDTLVATVKKRRNPLDAREARAEDGTPFLIITYRGDVEKRYDGIVIKPAFDE
jgi:hypothetical protein